MPVKFVDVTLRTGRGTAEWTGRVGGTIVTGILESRLLYMAGVQEQDVTRGTLLLLESERIRWMTMEAIAVIDALDQDLLCEGELLSTSG